MLTLNIHMVDSFGSSFRARIAQKEEVFRLTTIDLHQQQVAEFPTLQEAVHQAVAFFGHNQAIFIKE